MGPRFFKRGELEAALQMAAEDDASMGPRFFKRGEFAARRGHQNTSAQLQWGHASSSVESKLLGMPWIDARRASMGPRFFKRGESAARNHCAVQLHRFNGATLLQAWRVALGFAAEGVMQLQWGHASSSVESWDRRRSPDAGEQASMGPRFFKRGERAPRRDAKRARTRLQWGHASSSVERR